MLPLARAPFTFRHTTPPRDCRQSPRFFDSDLQYRPRQALAQRRRRPPYAASTASDDLIFRHYTAFLQMREGAFLATTGVSPAPFLLERAG